MNPATFSAPLSRLFLPGVIAAELRAPGNPELLLPDEAGCVERAVPQRAQEFAAGRLCARRALAALGIAGFAIKSAADRQPIWPDGVVGSITHTAGFCAAAVAERRCADALGLDSEVVGDVPVDIWPRICLPTELAWVGSLPASEQAAAITLIFSSKEAFYKCQYAVVGERLDFNDVRVEAAWGACEGAFWIHPARDVALARRTMFPLQGRYLFHEGFATAGLGLAAAAAAGQ